MNYMLYSILPIPIVFNSSMIISAQSTTNAISAYNTSTGLWTCPISGVYYFTYGSQERNASGSGKKNGGEIGVLIDGTPYPMSLNTIPRSSETDYVGNKNTPACGSCITSLNLNDTVGLRINTGSTTMGVYNTNFQIWRH